MTIAPPPSRGHARRNSVHEPEVRANIDVEHLDESIIRKPRHRAVIGIDRGVSDKDVGRTIGGFRALDEMLDLALVGYVAIHGSRLATVLSDLVDHILAGVELAAAHHNSSSRAGVELRDRAPDAPRSPRNDRSLAVQPQTLHTRFSPTHRRLYRLFCSPRRLCRQGSAFVGASAAVSPSKSRRRNRIIPPIHRS